jgi:hypothetical protein
MLTTPAGDMIMKTEKPYLLLTNSESKIARATKLAARGPKFI